MTAYQDKATQNAISGAGDIGFAILPFAVNVKSVKLLDDVASTVSSKVDEVMGMKWKNVDGGSATTDEILNGGEQWLGNSYKEIDEGVFRSSDNKRQFRITNSDLTDPKQGSHGHFESIGADGREIMQNAHVKIKD